MTTNAVKRAAASILVIAGSKRLKKNRPQSMDETQRKSPKVCFASGFSGIHISFTKSGAILGGWPDLSCPAKAGHPVLTDAAGDYWIIRLRG